MISQKPTKEIKVDIRNEESNIRESFFDKIEDFIID